MAENDGIGVVQFLTGHPASRSHTGYRVATSPPDIAMDSITERL